MTYIWDFYLKIFSFLEVKCSIYLNRLVFVMPLLSRPMLMRSLIRVISVCRQALFLHSASFICWWYFGAVCPFQNYLTLKLPITTIVVCLVILLVILSHFCKQCGSRSDCSSRSSLIWIHTVCLYVKIGLKSLQEYSADNINRRHFQMHVFLAF